MPEPTSATSVSKVGLATSPALLRRYLEQRGPLYVKLGQQLGLRPDLIDQRYCDELLKMTDRVPAFSFAEAKQIILEDLGGKLDDHFDFIESSPFAAGSLAQVHRARALDGRLLAVKIQRPGIHAAIDRDFATVRVVARLLRMTGAGTLIDADAFARELETSIRNELDFRRELVNQRQLWQLTKELHRSQIPEAYAELSGPRVLCSELLSGTPLSELLDLSRTGQTQRILKLGLEPEVVAENLLYSVLDQVFRVRLFHADIHPGNILILSGNRIGFVDFGLTDSLDPHFERGMSRYLSAVEAQDVEWMFSALTDIVVPTRTSDLDGLRSEFHGQTSQWLRELRYPRTEGQSPHAGLLVAVLRAARRHGFRIPTAILSLYRSVLTAESIAVQLGAQANIATAARPVFQVVQQQALLDACSEKNLRLIALELMALFKDGPRQFAKILAEAADGRFILRTRTESSAEDRDLANSRTRLLTLAIVSVALAFLCTDADQRVVALSLTASQLYASALFTIWAAMIYFWRKLR